MFALDALNPDPFINFKELSVKISIDNAMLGLLDGNLNVKGSPNENYAREFHELYSIGRGLEGTCLRQRNRVIISSLQRRMFP